MPHRIAFLGLGRMGAPMARRLVDAGHTLTVWNRTLSRAEALTGAGATAAATPGEAVRGAEIVISMLADPSATESVYFGPEGAAAALGQDARVVEMSTIGPEAVRALAGRLPKGVSIVDAPVTGSTDKAAAGELTILTGGESSDVDAVADVLGTLGTVVRCGGFGSGAALKLVVNAGMITALAALGEILALADGLGLPEDLALELLGKGPLAGAITRWQRQGGDFPIGLAAKDLGLAADAHDAPLPVVAAARTRLAALADQDADVRHVVAGVRVV